MVDINVSNIEKYRGYIYFRAVVGSRAYGLAKTDSDVDWRGWYAPPSTHLFYLKKPPEQIENTNNADETYWELEKFIKLVLANNPNVLETLWSPQIEYPHQDTSDLPQTLVKIRRRFLSKRIIKTYGGYAISQWGRGIKYLDNGQQEQGWKHIMHLCRLLLSVTHTLKTGDLLVDIGKWRDDLLAIRAGRWGSMVVGEWRDELEEAFKKAQAETELPDVPDVKIAEKFLIQARRQLLPATWKN